MSANVYERFAARIAADPEYVRRGASAPAEARAFDWMLGAWDWTMHIAATPSTPARTAQGTFRLVPNSFGIGMLREGEDPSPWLLYDAFNGIWVLAMADRFSYGMMTSPGWIDGSARFEGDMTFMGVPLHFRQTITRPSEDEMHAVNEELIEGEWHGIDEIAYHRTAI